MNKILLMGVITLISLPAFAAETGPVRLLDTPAAAPVKVPADVWREIDAAMASLGRLVEGKKFEAMSADAAKIQEGIRWTVENPLSADKFYVGSLSGTAQHIFSFVETLTKGAAVKNAGNVNFSYRKLVQLIDSQRNVYQNPPAAQKTAESPAKTEKAAPQAKPDTAATKPTPKPQPAKKK